MASETFANRAELRRRLRARMGDSTDDTVNSQNQAQLNELLRASAQKVRDETTWKRLQMEIKFDTGIAQRYYNYPANCGPGDLKALSLWDEDAATWRPLQRRLILSHLETDVDLASSEDLEAAEGQPQIFEEISQPDTSPNTIASPAKPTAAIEIWPLSDDVYTLKGEFTMGGAQLTDDTTASMVDAELIVLDAFAEYLDDLGDKQRAARQRVKYEQRRQTLSAESRVGEKFQLGRGEWLRRQKGKNYREPPNIDTSLSVP